MSDLLDIRPGMFAIRAKYAGVPSITHPASDIVCLVETLARPLDADHQRRCLALLGAKTAGLSESILNQRQGR